MSRGGRGEAIRRETTEERLEATISALNADLERFLENAIVQGREVSEEALRALSQRLAEVVCSVTRGDGRGCWLLSPPRLELEGAERRSWVCPGCHKGPDEPGDVVWTLSRNISSIVVRLIESNRRLCERASRDPLTGVHNRAFFAEALQLEVAKAERTGGRILFIMIDIDQFKEVNDTQGHLRGDELLTDVAELLKANVRASDLVIRYGGDEFLVVAPRAGEEACPTIVERLRRAERGGAGVSAGLSMGCSTWSPGGDVHEAIRSADRRMYEEKRRKWSSVVGMGC